MPELPYAPEALAPKMSKETFDYHYGKHLQTYVNNLNNLIAGTPYEEMPLDEIVRKADGGIFNNAAQAWNHTFFFRMLTPAQQPMPAKLAAKLTEAFGSVEAFKEQFTKAAVGLFGAVRLRMGVAGDGQGREVVDRRQAERRQPDDRRTASGDDRGRLGARLLHRLPQPSSRFSGGVLGADRLAKGRRPLHPEAV